jgi:arylformamidase
VRIIDISLPLGPGLPVYPGDPALSLDRVASADPREPGSSNLSVLHMTTHCGTHVDPPLHLGGAQSIDQVPLEGLCGQVRVINLEGGPRAIDARTLAASGLGGLRRVLLRTHSGAMHEPPYRRDHAYLTADAAAWLRDEARVVLVGTDCLSIDASDGGPLVAHRALLLAEPSVIVVEGLDLRQVADGEYELYCLPLRLAGGDGGPARAVLVER